MRPRCDDDDINTYPQLCHDIFEVGSGRGLTPFLVREEESGERSQSVSVCALECSDPLRVALGSDGGRGVRRRCGLESRRDWAYTTVSISFTAVRREGQHVYSTMGMIGMLRCDLGKKGEWEKGVKIAKMGRGPLGILGRVSWERYIRYIWDK
jgi:hypothetical protein